MQGRGAIQLPEGEGRKSFRRRAPHVIASATLPTRGIRLRNENHRRHDAERRRERAKDKVDTVLNYLIKNFPEKPAAAGRDGSRKRRGFLQGMESPHAGLAAARSARRA